MPDRPRGRILVATRSEGKLRELRPLLESAGFEVLDLVDAAIAESLAEDGIEVFESFAENAMAKARYFHARSGIPTIADDSGLAVDALGGRPGVRSKRFSNRPDLAGGALDAANNAALLHAFATLPSNASRSARYVCAAAYVDARRELVALGETRGRMLDTPRGEDGFGYDPFFLSDELGRTFAEVAVAEKSAISHRGRALAALLDLL